MHYYTYVTSELLQHLYHLTPATSVLRIFLQLFIFRLQSFFLCNVVFRKL